jgi:hypothetical protein
VEVIGKSYSAHHLFSGLHWFPQHKAHNFAVGIRHIRCHRITVSIHPGARHVLKVWKQATQFSAPEDWMFASPFQIGRLSYSCTGVKQDATRHRSR